MAVKSKFPDALTLSVASPLDTAMSAVSNTLGDGLMDKASPRQGH